MNGEYIMDTIIKWHKNLSESVRKKLGMSHYGLYWVSFFKGMLFILIVLALVGCQTTVQAMSSTPKTNQTDIVIPKYFFANELTKETCSLEGVHGHGSWGKHIGKICYNTRKQVKPNQGNNYDLMKLVEYDWNKDLKKTNSIYATRET